MSDEEEEVVRHPPAPRVEFDERANKRKFVLPMRSRLTPEEAIQLAENIFDIAGSQRLEEKYPDEEGYVTVRPGNFADDCAQEIAEVISDHYDEVPEELIQRVKVEVEEVTEVTFVDPEYEGLASNQED